MQTVKEATEKVEEPSRAPEPDLGTRWMARNVAELLVGRAATVPRARFGIVGDDISLADAVAISAKVARTVGAAGLRPGSCAMVIGTTSLSYLLGWAALQLAGVQTALVNPTYPADLLGEMARNLEPDVVVWIGGAPDPAVAPNLHNFDLTEMREGLVTLDGEALPWCEEMTRLPGLNSSPVDIASYMHTSGTTGTPKFCAQSHEYLLRLGRFTADNHGIGPADLVLAPLPMFHVNPLGYGVMGALIGGAGVLGCERFSASAFWPTVIAEKVTVAILHLPPVTILKAATTADDAAGHSVRTVFGGDPDFLEHFGISQGVLGYGSTEAGGLCHSWIWRRGDSVVVPEGISHLAGTSRYDIEWTVDSHGEILVRDRSHPAIFSGYRREGVVEPSLDDDGWLHTGDRGRVDGEGRLIFIERMSESIRSRGEYVPIDFVESRLSEVDGLDDFAIWRRQAMADFDVVLYLTGEDPPLGALRAVLDDLPKFMRPVAAHRIAHIPRDTGVGKVQRRRLEETEVLQSWQL